jgi:hypothetical protein
MHVLAIGHDTFLTEESKTVVKEVVVNDGEW